MGDHLSYETHTKIEEDGGSFRRICSICKSWVIDHTFIRRTDHTEECEFQRISIDDTEETMQINYSDDEDRMDKLDKKLDTIMNRLLEIVEEVNNVHDIASAAYESVEACVAQLERLQDGLGANEIEVETY